MKSYNSIKIWFFIDDLTINSDVVINNISFATLFNVPIGIL